MIQGWAHDEVFLSFVHHRIFIDQPLFKEIPVFYSSLVKTEFYWHKMVGALCAKTKYLKCSRRQDQLKPINNENKEIEQVRSFQYLGSTVNTDNTKEEEIKERIALGDKVFFANIK